MALADFTYRLKPQSGDTTAHDEKGVSGDLTGGTITLQDMGASDYAWRFVGAASVAGPSRTMANAAGGGLTVAWRLRVPTYGTVNRDRMIGYGPSAGITSALRLAKDNNSGDFDARSEGAASPTLVGAPLTGMGTAIRTIVLKIQQDAADSADVIKLWMDKVGRSGSTPDLVTAGFNHTVASAFNKIYCGGATGTIDVADFVVWGEELSDADCAALADTGIRATLDASVSPPAAPTIGTTTAISNTGATINWTDNSADETGFKVEWSPSPYSSWTADSGSPAAANATSLAITGLSPATTYKARVASTNAGGDSAWVETATFTTTNTVKKLKLKIDASAAGATNVSGVVWAAQPGAIAGAEIGEFTGQAFEAALEGGQAVLKVPVSAFGGGSLTVSDTPVALVRNATNTSGIVSCTVIEE